MATKRRSNEEEASNAVLGGGFGVGDDVEGGVRVRQVRVELQ